MGRLGVIGAGLVSAGAFGQVATFTPLRGDEWPFPVVGGSWRGNREFPPLSGDGSTVTDGRWRWTRSGGVVPVGFVPGFNQSSEYVRSPLDLSYDGSIEVGRLVRFGDRIEASPYWEGAGRFELLPSSATRIFQRDCLSDDGGWVVFTHPPTAFVPFTQYRGSRSGHSEAYPWWSARNSGTIWSPSADASSALTVDGVLRVGPEQAAGDAVLQPKPVFYDYPAWPISMSSNGRLVLLYQRSVPDGNGYSRMPFGVIWNTDTGETDRFGVPLGFDSIFLEPDMYLSDSGELAAGAASNFLSTSSARAFVRRRGEQARELRVVLDRFGDTSSNYYVIERVSGLSRDGRTILVLYSSPLWYGDGAAIVTLPDWEPCPADLNFDGFVDDADFSIFAKAYDRLTTTDGDLNVDRFTDDADFSIFAVAYDALLCP
jgi:hypothetical protein